MTKSKLGQFYTKKSEYIIGNLKKYIPQNEIIIDPFAGEWDLLNNFENPKEAYDIEPKNKDTIKRDTLFNPPSYENKWVITNPPYLARNKNIDKKLYDKYETDDLYKISLKTIIGCKGGIIILPVNFFSSQNDDIRELFLSRYKVEEVNVFEDRTFDDTSYTVCSFFFIEKNNNEQKVNFIFKPSNIEREFILYKNQGYRIGYDVYSLEKSNVRIKRLLKGDEEPNSNIFLRAVDTGGESGKISLSIKEPFFGKKTDRVFATIVFGINLSKEEQEKIVEKFNERISHYRNKYNSLLFTNYRDKGRKRISFNFAYLLISNILKEELGY